MNDRRRETRDYAIGYLLALALTVAAFAAVRWPGTSATTTFAIVLALALVQAVVHFRFFLRITLGKSARADLQLILFSTLIIAMMVAGTIVVMLNLRGRMM